MALITARSGLEREAETVKLGADNHQEQKWELREFSQKQAQQSWLSVLKPCVSTIHNRQFEARTHDSLP
jgi:hypothetical protein